MTSDMWWHVAFDLSDRKPKLSLQGEYLNDGEWEQRALQGLEGFPEDHVFVWEDRRMPGDFLHAVYPLLTLCSQRARVCLEEAGIQGILFSPVDVHSLISGGRLQYWLMGYGFEFQRICFRSVYRSSGQRLIGYRDPVVTGLNASIADVYIGPAHRRSYIFFSSAFVKALKKL
jgi:hypothetical protein